MTAKRYWLTPPDLMERLEAKYGPFTFDPCPCPVPDGFNGLEMDWGLNNYVNPPFRRKDGVDGRAGTAFLRKAIAEQAEGRSSTFVLSAQSWIGLALDAGAELHNLGRVKWLDVETGEPCKSPSPIILAHLPGKQRT